MIINRQVYWILGLILGLSVSSCGDRGQNEGLPTIDLEKAISIGKRDKLDRADWNVETVNLAETDSTVLGLVHLAGMGDNNVWVFDMNKLYEFSKDGDCLSILDKKGDGPEDYLNIISAQILPENRILVADVRRLNLYSESRNLLLSKNYDIASLLTTGKDLLGLGFPGENPDSVQLIWMKDDLSKKDSIIIPYGQIKNGLWFVNEFLELDGKPGLLSADTVFSLAKEGEKIPELTFSTGKLSLPAEIVGDWDRLEEREKYICIFNVVLWNDLAFLEYGYNEKSYHDIWSIKDKTLLFRNIVADIKEGFGMPLELPDGKTIWVWPTRVIEDKLVGMIFYAFQPEETEEDSNPGVFIVSRK